MAQAKTTKVVLVSVVNGCYCQPMTKKNHSEVIMVSRGKGKGTRPMVRPSASYREWEAGVISNMLGRRMIHWVSDRTTTAERNVGGYVMSGARIIEYAVNCEAMIYRNAEIGDAVGYYQAVADCLEKIGVLLNDRQIRSWDGSLLLKDAKFPRVEITLKEI